MRTNIKDTLETEGSPYQQLYVYYLSGVVKEKDEAGLGDAFVGNWVEGDSSFLFFAKPAKKIVTRLLKSDRLLELVDDYHFPYEEWQGGVTEPIEVDDFVIIPPWIERPTHQETIQIILDPSVVFGNGLHPTTRDCLRALLHAYRRMPFKNVLDLGTGTGILALAAALLGADGVLAVDLNPLCVKTTIRNAELNGLDGIIRVVEDPAEMYTNEPADLVVANIPHAVIQSLLDRRVFREKERLILSGLMRTQYREVNTQLEGSRFRIIHEWDHGMTWFTILAEKI
jgi:ribosomal protein L11 methyltransferase